MRAKSVVPVVVLQRSITTITAPLLLLPNTTTSNHYCSPLLHHRNKNSSKNYPINRSGMLLTSSFDLWGQKSNLSANFGDHLRLGALFFEGERESQGGRMKEEEGGRKGGAARAVVEWSRVSAGSEPKGSFRPAGSRKPGPRSAACQGACIWDSGVPTAVFRLAASRKVRFGLQCADGAILLE